MHLWLEITASPEYKTQSNGKVKTSIVETVFCAKDVLLIISGASEKCLLR